MEALLRFHFKIDPDELSDEDFAMRWGELLFALDHEAKRTTKTLK